MTTRIGVYGAGTVGCYVGGRLASAGSDVVLIGRERLAREIAEHGLHLTDWRGFEARLDRVDYRTTPTAADLVLVTVKSAATATAASELAGVLKPGAVVVSFQNGLRNASVLREHLPDHTVLTGMVQFNVITRGGGSFHEGVEGRLEVERHPSLEPFLGDFERAGLPLQLRDDMQSVQWAKLLLNLNNAINALSGLTLRDELSQRAYRRCFAAAQREALRLLDAAGIKPAQLTRVPPHRLPLVLELPDFVFTRAARAMLAIDPLARASMCADLDAGRPTEVDYLNGEVVRLGPAPINARLVELVHDAERGGRRTWPGPDLYAELVRSRRQAAGS
jgi:2-dehydropantoate 2-reductase